VVYINQQKYIDLGLRPQSIAREGNLSFINNGII
jgi:hypothetical protein